MKNKILILHLDAMKFTYLDRMTFLKSFCKKSVSGILQPDPGYSNMGGFLTGQPPKKSGCFTTTIYSKRPFLKSLKFFLPFFSFFEKFGFKKQSRFLLFSIVNLLNIFKGVNRLIYLKGIPLEFIDKIKLADKKSYAENGAFSSKSLFDIARENNYRFIFYTSPFITSEKEVKKNLSEIIFFNSDDFRTKKFIKLLKKDSDLFYIQLWDLDSFGHKEEIDSEKFIKRIKNLDSQVQKIIKVFLKKHPDGKIFIWSDHGMTKVRGTIDLKLQPGRFFYFLDGTLARFWGLDDNLKKEIREKMKSLGMIELDSKLKKKYGLNFNHNLFGELIFTSPVGKIIFPNSFIDKYPDKNMHGFFFDPAEEQGFYLVYPRDPNIKINKKINVKDIFPIIKEKIC